MLRRLVPLFALLIACAACDAVDATNDAPAFASTPDTLVFAGEAYRYAVALSDPNGDALSLTLAEGPPWLTIDSTAGAYALTALPVRDAVGMHDVRLVADDGAATTEQTFSLWVAHPEAGTYEARRFHDFRFYSGCLGTYDALERGGYFDLALHPTGTFEAEYYVGPGGGSTPRPFDGRYTVRNDTLRLASDTPNVNVGFYDTWQISLPRLRTTYMCDGEVELARVDPTL